MHLALPLLLLLATGPQDEARAARVLAVAERYATLPWHATEANAFHGEDPDGVPVDTPDAGLRAGGWTLAGDNVGVPYKWGGWATPEQFLEGIEAGRWAGHWPRDASDPRTTTGAVGVDCSGFVSRCWSLPYKHSTRSLGPLCWEIGWDELQPGDLLNSFDGHAILFKGWANEERTRVIGYEATWPKVVLKERRVDALRRGGLVPQRYKPLDPRWPKIEPAAATTLPRGSGHFVAAEVLDPDTLVFPWRGQAGDWVRYRWTSGLGSLDLTRSIATAGEDQAPVIARIESAQGSMQRLTDVPLDAGMASLRHLFPSGQPIDTIEVRSLRAERGSTTRGERVFEASSIELSIGGTFTVRGRTYPFEADLQVVRSDDLPLEGVLWARMTSRVDLGQGPRSSVGRLVLVAYGAD